MIQKYKQFINEGVENKLSTFDAINTPYTEFLERAQERMDMFKERIAEIITRMNKTLETAVTEFEDVIVGEPIIEIDDRYFDEIDVKIHTNVSNSDEEWRREGSRTLELEQRVSDWLSDYRNGIQADIYYKSDDDGNCIIHIRTYVVVEDNFGEFTDAIRKMGEEY